MLVNKEDELIVLVYCAKNDSTGEVTPKTRYCSVCNSERADAAGLLACLQDFLKNLGVDEVLDKDSVLEDENKPVLMGATTDGTTVNVAEQNGLRGRMQHGLPWLFWSWCFAHGLELACSNAFTSPLFCRVEEKLLRLFYI